MTDSALLIERLTCRLEGDRVLAECNPPGSPSGLRFLFGLDDFDTLRLALLERIFAEPNMDPVPLFPLSGEPSDRTGPFLLCEADNALKFADHMHMVLSETRPPAERRFAKPAYEVMTMPRSGTHYLYSMLPGAYRCQIYCATPDEVVAITASMVRRVVYELPDDFRPYRPEAECDFCLVFRHSYHTLDRPRVYFDLAPRQLIVLTYPLDHVVSWGLNYPPPSHGESDGYEKPSDTLAPSVRKKNQERLRFQAGGRDVRETGGNR